MAQRTRENIAILLFFLPLAYLTFKGWDSFCATGDVPLINRLHVLVPVALMVAALIIWPGRARDEGT